MKTIKILIILVLIFGQFTLNAQSTSKMDTSFSVRTISYKNIFPIFDEIYRDKGLLLSWIKFSGNKDSIKSIELSWEEKNKSTSLLDWEFRTFTVLPDKFNEFSFYGEKVINKAMDWDKKCDSLGITYLRRKMPIDFMKMDVIGWDGRIYKDIVPEIYFVHDYSEPMLEYVDRINEKTEEYSKKIGQYFIEYENKATDCIIEFYFVSNKETVRSLRVRLSDFYSLFFYISNTEMLNGAQQKLFDIITNYENSYGKIDEIFN